MSDKRNLSIASSESRELLSSIQIVVSAEWNQFVPGCNMDAALLDSLGVKVPYILECMHLYCHYIVCRSYLW